jgi:hypothetical protein
MAMHADPKTVALTLALLAAAETLRRLNGGHIRGIETVPFRAVEVAKGPRGAQP